MKLSQYKNYQQPESDWQGEIPKGWSSLALGRLFRRVKRTGFENEELLSVYRDHGVILKSSRDDNHNKPSDDLSPYQLVQPGELVMNKMKAWQGSIAISEHRGIVSPAYFVYEPWKANDDRMHSRYVHYLLRSPIYVAQYLRQSKGIRVSQWDLDPEQFERIEILLPHPDEQKQIASFLDYETAEIDALIEKQQQLIALLGEKRQAVISHAVTKGLNPDAPMRDSGVEWLGEVPEHWVVSKVKHHFDTCSGGTPNTSQREKYYADDQDGVPWIRTTDLNNDFLTSVPIHITEQAVRDSACSLLPEATVMIALYGGAGTVGKNGLLMFPATINQAVCGILPSVRFESEYVFRYMQFYRPHWMIGAESSRKDPNISQDEVKNAPILCPPHDEQIQIVKHLRMALEKFGTLTEKADYQVELLQERRTALISAAVTGKIDVRGWKRPSAAPKKETEMEVA